MNLQSFPFHNNINNYPQCRLQRGCNGLKQAKRSQESGGKVLHNCYCALANCFLDNCKNKNNGPWGFISRDVCRCVHWVQPPVTMYLPHVHGNQPQASCNSLPKLYNVKAMVWQVPPRASPWHTLRRTSRCRRTGRDSSRCSPGHSPFDMPRHRQRHPGYPCHSLFLDGLDGSMVLRKLT